MYINEFSQLVTMVQEDSYRRGGEIQILQMISRRILLKSLLSSSQSFRFLGQPQNYLKTDIWRRFGILTAKKIENLALLSGYSP